MDTAQLVIMPLATLISAIAAEVAVYFAYRISKQESRSQEAQVFFEIVERYNAIYDRRNELMKMDLTWSKFHSNYPSYEDKVNSDEWRLLRAVAAGYELIGILVKYKYIAAEIVFDMVVVRPQLWEHARDLVFHMRRWHNPNQWVNWEFLVEKELEC